MKNVKALIENVTLASAEEVEALVRFSMDFGKKAGAGAMRTDTHYQNLPARRLYTRCGFTSLGPWEAFIENRDQKFDVFEYLYGKKEIE